MAGVLVVTLASLACYGPTTTIDITGRLDIKAIVGRVPAVARVEEVQAQYFDPWSLLATGHWEATSWRVAVPALVHWLHLPLGFYFLLPRMGGFLLVLVVAWLAWKETDSAWPAIAAAALCATASAFFVAMDWIQFDPFYLLALLGAAYMPSSLGAFCCCALGPWVDERFVLILPAVAVLRLARGRKAILPIALGVVPYLGVRLAALALGDQSVSQQMAVQKVFNPYFAFGWVEGFRLGWLAVGAGTVWAFAAVRRAHGTAVTVGLAVGTLAGLGACVWLAYDTSRSIAVLLPFLPQGVAVIWTRRYRLLLLAAMCGLNFVTPAGHVIGKRYFPISPIWQSPDWGAKDL